MFGKDAMGAFGDNAWLLKVRLDKDGKIIPENEDIKKANENHPNESDAEKFRLAQGYALAKTIEEYDVPVIKGVKLALKRRK